MIPLPEAPESNNSVFWSNDDLQEKIKNIITTNRTYRVHLVH